MGFVDKLRMQNIFPNSNLNLGFTGKIPAYGGRDPMEQIINRFQELVPREQTVQSSNRISQVADKLVQPQQPKNVVIKEDMTPFQRESLKLRKEQIGNISENQEQNRALAGKRIDIAKFKADNPNKRFIAVKGGNIMAFNPQTGEAEDTGINSGSLTDEERLQITQGITERNENTRQTNRLELEGERQNNRLEVRQYDKDNPDDEWSNPVQTFNPDGSPALIIQVNKKDGKTRTVQAGGNLRSIAPGTQPPLQPSQEINARKLRIQGVLNRNPGWSRYVDPETGQVKPVGTGFGDADLTEDMRKKIVDEIEGSTKESINEGNANVPNNTPKAPPLPQGFDPNVWEYVPKPGGGWTAKKKGTE